MSPLPERLLSRLEGVREKRAGQWSACCPAHDDKHPSLLIDIGSDGRLLLYCYAGCSAADVMAAVGLSLGDLFERPSPGGDARHYPRRPLLTARDVALALGQERMIVLGVANDMLRGETPTAADLERLALAGQRIARLAEIAS